MPDHAASSRHASASSASLAGINVRQSSASRDALADGGRLPPGGSMWFAAAVNASANPAM